MSRRVADTEALQDRIGHQFSDATLLTRALTHSSALSSARGRLSTYQRLEFLGDRVLGLCISDMLFATFPDADEGELSRRLSELVRRQTCAEVAVEWGVGQHLLLGASETRGGGRRNGAILADAFEAIVGAVFLDGGYAGARAVVERAFAERMQAPKEPLRDAKTALQEWAQAHGRPAPAYAIVERSGPDHAPEFLVSAAVAGQEATVGRGRSRRDAEQAAAAAMLRREGVWTAEPEPAGEVS